MRQHIDVKICGIRSDGDLAAAVESGADAVGFLVGQEHYSEDFITVEQAVVLRRKVPDHVKVVLTTHKSVPADVLRMIRAVEADAVQLHGDASLRQVNKLKQLLPAGVTLRVAFHVRGSTILPDPSPYFSCLDGLVLDTVVPARDRVGGTGKVHDWDVSARFCRACPVPVWLAGGLTPANVKVAIAQVYPFGVDVNSGVEDEGGNKSAAACRAFVEHVKSTVRSDTFPPVFSRIQVVAITINCRVDSWLCH